MAGERKTDTETLRNILAGDQMDTSAIQIAGLTSTFYQYLSVALPEDVRKVLTERYLSGVLDMVKLSMAFQLESGEQ